MFVFQVYMHTALIIMIISTILTSHSDMYVIFLENYSCFNRLKHSLALQQHPHFVTDLEPYGYLGIGIKPVEIER